MLKPTTYHLIIKKEYERIIEQLLQKEKIEFTKSKSVANNAFDSSLPCDAKQENYFIYCLFNVNANTIFSIGLEVGKHGTEQISV